MVGITSPKIDAEGVSARAHSASDALLKTFHDAQDVRLPLPAKHDVVSHSISAWKTGSAVHMSTLRACAIAVVSTYQNDFPVPIATTRLLQQSLRTQLTANTTTSVSTVLMTIVCFPCLTPSAACKNILVLASSCVRGDSPYITTPR